MKTGFRENHLCVLKLYKILMVSTSGKFHGQNKSQLMVDPAMAVSLRTNKIRPLTKLDYFTH